MAAQSSRRNLFEGLYSSSAFATSNLSPAAQSADVWEEAMAAQQLLVDHTTLGAPQLAGHNGEMKWTGAAGNGLAQRCESSLSPKFCPGPAWQS